MLKEAHNENKEAEGSTKQFQIQELQTISKC